MPSLGKPFQVVAAENDKLSLQPTMNGGAGGARLAIFVTDCTFFIAVLTFVVVSKIWQQVFMQIFDFFDF